MTYQEINQMVSSIGLPYAYYQFTHDTAKAPPFICFYYPNNDDVYADDENYQRITAFNIELYTNQKDFVNEKQVEDVLHNNHLTYTKTETYIADERMYMVLYESEVMING